MGRRRHALNPAKLKADLAALNPPAGPPRGRFDPRRKWVTALLSLLSPLVLLISFAPFDYWMLAYVALVPWALAVLAAPSRRWAMLWSYLAGVVFWAVGLYWLTWITPLGYVLAVIYLAAYWLAAGAVLRRAYHRNWPVWIVLPVIWVALEYARAFVLSGFPWFYLAHSQHSLPRLIQITDATGQYGMSFFVALANGIVLEALLRVAAGERRGLRGLLSRRLGIAAGAGAAGAALLLGYGTFRLGQQTMQPGPKVGVVQLAYPIALSKASPSSQEIFDAHVQMTRRLIGQGADLVVWPESMLGLPNMDPDYWLPLDAGAIDPRTGRSVFGLDAQELIREYQASLRTLAGLLRQLDCPLLAGAGMPARDPSAKGLHANSALLLDRHGPAGVRLVETYDKMHLVPFSEYVPFRQSWPGLHALLRQFVPPVMPQLAPGNRGVRFALPYRGQALDFAVPICYEGTFDRVCRGLADGERKLGMFVNISNDGWFIHQGDSATHASTELDQHLVCYVFRAIENRTSVVRAVNCGISAQVDPNGRMVQVLAANGRRKMIANTMIAQVLVDSRVSLYSLVGDAFAQAVSLGAVAIVAMVIRRTTKKDRPE